MSILLQERTRTHLHTVVNPGPFFLNDPEAGLRKLAHDEEEAAKKARNDRLSREMVNHARLAIRYHKEAEALYTPAPPVPKQIPVRWWETRIGVAIAWAVVMLALIAGIFFVLNHVAGVQ